MPDPQTRQTTLRAWTTAAFRPASALADPPVSICNTENPAHE